MGSEDPIRVVPRAVPAEQVLLLKMSDQVLTMHTEREGNLVGAPCIGVHAAEGTAHVRDTAAVCGHAVPRGCSTVSAVEVGPLPSSGSCSCPVAVTTSCE